MGYLSESIANDNLQEFESINHFRVFPILENSEKSAPYVRHTIQDKNGFLWISGEHGISLYDGYGLINYPLSYTAEGSQVNNPVFFVDRNEKLWAGQSGIHYFDRGLNEFVLIESTKNRIVYDILEDKDGLLWFGGIASGLTKFNLVNNEVIQHYDFSEDNKRPLDVISMVYERDNHVIWFSSYKGLYRFNIISETLEAIKTPLDGYFSSFILRDMSIDEKNNSLWLATQKGLLRVNTNDLSSRIYDNSNKDYGLATKDVTTTFIDSNNNLWIGLEKAGLCLYKNVEDYFICLKSSFNQKNRLPFATIEDIFEDKDGSLWLSMNQYGLIRVSPKLEKMLRFEDLATQPIDNYFPHSFDGIEQENGDIWFATDGGGINIINGKTGEFKNIQNEPSNPNSLGSNSVITLAQDTNGDIWAGTWSGGLSRIDPITFNVEVFQQDTSLPKELSIAGNNIFSVESDGKDGIWIAIWGIGIQHYDLSTKTFKNYIHKNAGGYADIKNVEIYHLQVFKDKLYVAGQNGLETLDPNTGEFTTIFDDTYGGLTYVLVESEERIWLGSFRGLIAFNPITDEHQFLTVDDGLSNNEVWYVDKVNDGELWIATTNGLSILDTNSLKQDNKQIRRFYQRDGLTGNELSAHGEFLISKNRVFIPGKYGITVVENNKLPNNENVLNADISQVSIINKSNLQDADIQLSTFKDADGNYVLPYESNSLRFRFTSPNYVFPEYNKYRYRLKGWQDEYVEVNASERFASYTNLPAGTYTFEVFVANSSGIWNQDGRYFTFKVLSPWWSTWWFTAIVLLVLAMVTYSIIRIRLSANIQREKYLSKKVDEKTAQLADYTNELEKTSDSLARLNHELEDRVLKRTQELQNEVTERKHAEQKLFHMAFHDSLTELPNREWIIQHIHTLIEKAKQHDEFSYAVMFLDGDRFKQINDTLGHLFGDKLLIACAHRLLKHIDGKGHAGRLGGDEFTIVLEDCNQQEAEALAARVVKAFEKPFKIDEATVYFNVSIGVVLCDKNYDLVPTVLKNADIAMYYAKEAGKSTYKTFDRSMENRTVKTSEIEQALRKAVKNDGFQLAYQPIFNLKTNQLDGFEALIRWHHPEKGFISPLDFIPIAEETGLIWEIGEWVLREACRQAKVWQLSSKSLKPTISINLSSNQLRNANFLELLDNVIDVVDIDSKYVKLELTESLLIENSHQLSQLYSKLKQRQIDLALDDFGTGYSSLAYLNEIPVQYLKIDRSFVAAIDDNTNRITNKNALKILRAIVSLGKGLGKQVTAEGIETQIQLDYLKEFDCDFAQGFYLAKPMNASDANQLVLDQDKLKPLSTD
jgi:diguanylate cyclase (GGDEF)-like protein